MPHKKFQRAAETVRKKRRRRKAKKRKQKAIKAAERQRRQRRIERNQPKNIREEAAATAARAKELGQEVVQTVQSELGSGSDARNETVEDTGRQPALLTSLPGVGEETARRLRERGFQRPRDIKQASVGSLLAVPGIGETKARRLIHAAGGTVREQQTSNDDGSSGGFPNVAGGLGARDDETVFPDVAGVGQEEDDEQGGIPNFAAGSGSGDSDDEELFPDFGSIDLGLDDE